MDDKPYAIYVGEGAFLNGVPARDLTKAEWDALMAAQRKDAVDLKLYKLTAPARSERQAKESAE